MGKKKQIKKKERTSVKREPVVPQPELVIDVEAPDLRWRWFWAISLFCLIFGFWLRTYQIEIRPFHNDEGVNHYFLQQLRSKGYYPYSHENYHGPSYFYLTQFFSYLIGDTEIGIRFSAILMGMCSVFLPLMLLRTEKRRFLAIAMLFGVCSASLVFYSRYAIHESLFLVAQILLAFSAYLWVQTGKQRYLFSGLFGLGLLVTTKETFIIALFCIGLATLSIGRYREIGLRLWRQRLALFQALTLAVLIVVVTFTGGFQWAGGLREMFLAVPQWIGRNTSDTGHFKPFWYYAVVMLGWRPFALVSPIVKTHAAMKSVSGTEQYLMFLIFLPVLYALFFGKRLLRDFFSERGVFGRFVFVWALSSFLVYSFVSYKTPWLIINITFPAILFLAWCTSKVWDYQEKGGIIGTILCASLLGMSVQSMWRYNFTIPYGKDNPFSYVHTHQGMMSLVDDIEAYHARHPDARILVGVAQYWPLPFYLKNVAGQLGYLNTKDPNGYASSYDVMILDSTVRWENPDWVEKYYRLSDVQESHTYFKRHRPQ